MRALREVLSGRGAVLQIPEVSHDRPWLYFTRVRAGSDIWQATFPHDRATSDKR
jgi:hypothetical protein